MDGPKPYEFIGFRAMDVTKPYEFIGFGAMEGPKPQIAFQNVSNLTFLNWESVVPEVPRTVGLPPAPGEARGPQIRSKSKGFLPLPPLPPTHPPSPPSYMYF